MQIFDLGIPGEIVNVDNSVAYSCRILPDDSIVITNTNLIRPTIPWETTATQLAMLRDQNITAKYVFIDGGYDPMIFTNREIVNKLNEINTYFPGAKVVLLSSRVQHWYDNIPNIMYVPFFAYIYFIPYQKKKRQGRISCLNRNNSEHRIWLMYNLLKDNLLSADKGDVYSISFENIYSNSRTRLETWLGTARASPEIDYAIAELPGQIATHPDGFPNDYTIDHPAWNTAVAIVTETQVNWRSMLTEKTWKAIRSRSCWTAYVGKEAYSFLEDVGFEPRMFPDHASADNIKPIVKICKTLNTEAVALDYYHSQIDKIAHNYEWSGGDNQESYDNFTTPWAQRFLAKFQRQLNSL